MRLQHEGRKIHTTPHPYLPWSKHRPHKENVTSEWSATEPAQGIVYSEQPPLIPESSKPAPHNHATVQSDQPVRTATTSWTGLPCQQQ
uniref:Uncharacterized protein n=1 Tax=Triticum urartu TaxID=4572 RepID=A0A8R7PL64_TRIUA